MVRVRLTVELSPDVSVHLSAVPANWVMHVSSVPEARYPLGVVT